MLKLTLLGQLKYFLSCAAYAVGCAAYAVGCAAYAAGCAAYAVGCAAYAAGCAAYVRQLRIRPTQSSCVGAGTDEVDKIRTAL